MLNVSSLSKYAGGKPLFTDVSFQVYEGEKVGLVGPNGAGKTTIFRLIIGEQQPDSGAISIQNNVRIAYFSQTVGEMKGRSALHEVIDGNKRVGELAALLKSYEERLCDPALDPETMEDILARMGDEQIEFEKLGGFDIETNAQTIITGLGIAPCDHAKPVEDFSSGWKMRIALAKVLIMQPDLILMDEPTNHLDMTSRMVLLDALKRYEGTVLLVSHDRYFIRELTTRVFEVDRGRIRVYEGDYRFYLEERDRLSGIR